MQISIPLDQCRELGLKPGDELETFVANGFLTVIKRKKGAAKGRLRHVPAQNQATDEPNNK